MSRKKIESKTKIGNVIIEARKHSGITQECLAKLTGIGLSRLKEYEHGDELPTIDALVYICYFLGLNVMDVIYQTELSYLKSIFYQTFYGVKDVGKC